MNATVFCAPGFALDGLGHCVPAQEGVGVAGVPGVGASRFTPAGPLRIAPITSRIPAGGPLTPGGTYDSGGYHGATKEPAQNPTCPLGYYWNWQTTTCIPQTTPGAATWEPSGPVVGARYWTACPHGTHRDPVSSKCLPNEISGLVYDTNRGVNAPVQWSCPPGTYWDPNLAKCVPGNIGDLIYQTNLVQAGENTSMVAERLGTSVEALVAANPELPRVMVGGRAVFAMLREGQTLRLP
jgi:hypothetical protein